MTGPKYVHVCEACGVAATLTPDEAYNAGTVHVQRAIAAQGEHMQWIEGRLAAARAIASYLASYPAEHTGRQIGWIAQALSLRLSPQTFSAEIIDAYRRQTPHSATETPARHPQPALTIAR